MPLALAHDVPLAPRTTLHIGGPARRLATVTTVDELCEALDLADRDRERVLVLGGGSNLVVSDAGWPGLAIAIAIPGVAIELRPDDAVVVASAGVVWDELVEELVDAGLAGVECLSGIPGLVGATPMQNVGAYGQEVADTITRVRVLDRETRALVDFTPEQCGFAYRTSVFKGSPRWIVVEVELCLRRQDDGLPIRYAELAKSLGVGDGESAPLAVVRERVIALRRGKGMVLDANDPDSRSAGSFFMNPIVEPAVVSTLQTRLPTGTVVPTFPAPDGKVKLPAAWLIERAGFTKGFSRGAVGISNKHALALVNRGGATAAELLALAHEIQEGVRARLGVELHPEPVIV